MINHLDQLRQLEVINQPAPLVLVKDQVLPLQRLPSLALTPDLVRSLAPIVTPGLDQDQHLLEVLARVQLLLHSRVVLPPLLHFLILLLHLLFSLLLVELPQPVQVLHENLSLDLDQTRQQNKILVQHHPRLPLLKSPEVLPILSRRKDLAAEHRKSNRKTQV